MRVRIRNQLWTVVFKRLRKYYGLCYFADRRIELSTTNSDFEMLVAAVHEMMHAAFPDISEESVDESSRDIGVALWKLGYRRESANG